MKNEMEKRELLKRDVMVRLSKVDENKKRILIAKYMLEDQSQIMNPDSVKVLIGNWVNNACNFIANGATEEEIDRVIEHIIVLRAALKHNIDVKKSYKDRDLLGLSRKYLGTDNPEIRMKEKTENV